MLRKLLLSTLLLGASLLAQAAPQQAAIATAHPAATAAAQQMLDAGFRPVGRDFPVFLHPRTGEQYALARRERKQGHGYGGFAFDTGPFDLGEVSFHLGWTFHKAGPNTSAQPRSVMTVIYMDADMHLVPALNAIQANDRDQWCPGAREGEPIATRKNPVIWER